jgi:hypothetical protein
MKVYFLRKILLYLFVSVSLYLTSCVDKSVDWDNLSTDMSVGGSIPAPLFKESKLSLYKILEQYHPDDMQGVVIDTTENGDIYLAYDSTFTYAMSTLNNDFTMFADNMFNIGISDIFKDTPILSLLGLTGTDATLPIGLHVNQVVPYEYDMNKNLAENEMIGRQRLDSILFRNTDIVLTIDPSFDIHPGVLKIQIKIPGVNPPLPEISLEPGKTEYRFSSYEHFRIDAKGKIEITFNVEGDGKTKIGFDDEIRFFVGFESHNPEGKPDYVAYGLFNYSLEFDNDFKMDTYIASLYNYVPEADNTVLSLENPQFNFELSSNMGIPLQFSLDTIISYLHSREPEIFLSKGNAVFDIKATDEIGKTVITDDIRTIDNAFFQDYGNQKFSNFINTSMDSLYFSYRLAAREVDIDNPDQPIEFIPSDGELKVVGKLKVPMIFGETSVICYRDTIKLDFDFESLDDVSKLELRFHYINHIPLGFYVHLSLLDESYENLLDNKPYQSILINKPGVDEDGAVNENELAKGEGDFSLIFTKDTETSISQMKNAKYLIFEYRSREKDDPEERIRLKASDYISIKLGAIIDGRIIF